MAANDPYIPDFATVANDGNATFDGSDAATNAAFISEMSGNFDAEIYIDHSNDGGSSWTTIAQLTDDEGNTTFTADWHTQFNRLMVEANTRRVRIEDAASGGEVDVTGDERGS